MTVELECLKIQLAKFETLSRVRGERIFELEDLVITLSKAQRTLQESNRILASTNEALLS